MSTENTKTSPTKAPNRIFISYRREDGAPQAYRLNDWLSNRQFLTFMDIDTIPCGVDFRKAIKEELRSCSVFLAVVGTQWINSPRDGKRRLDNPNDFVRIELADALNRGITVIPILVQNASMPSPDDLPDELKEFAYLNALSLSDIRWKDDVERLIRALNKTLADLEERRKKEAEQQIADEEARKRLEEAQKKAKEEARIKADEEATPKADETEIDESKLKSLLASPAHYKWIIAAGILGLIVLGTVFSAVFIFKDSDPTPTPSTLSSASSDNTNEKSTPPSIPQIEMVLIPAGTFMMGQKPSDSYSNRYPQHPVTVPSFYISKYEITQEQYRAVMGMNPSFFKGDNLPVASVSWNDAVDFCRKLSQMTGKEYRLPTEAEWEYACRAGTTGDSAGDVDAMGWYIENSGERIHPVGEKQPNAYGLYDMYGNVQEWCLDYYHENYKNAPKDGSAWLLPPHPSFYRVLRGGGVKDRLSDSTYRDGSPTATREFYIGFRVVMISR